MRRKRFIISSALILCLTLSVGVSQSVARARSTTISFTAQERGSYACLGPCATATNFTFNEIVHTGSKALGTATLSAVGTVLDFNPATNCLDQSEQWALTTQSGNAGKDSIFISTNTDTFCFTNDPNVSIETATFAITGGTGRFADATGSGSSTETVLTHPQTASGTITATITY